MSILGEYLQRVKAERDEALKLLRSLRNEIAVADFPDWNLLGRTDDFLSRYDLPDDYDEA